MRIAESLVRRFAACHKQYMGYESERVRAANLRLYESVASRYEEIDPRRSGLQLPWLREKLSTLRQKLPEEAIILDAGAGSGFLLRHANEIFTHRIALDLSPKMLARIDEPSVEKILGSCEKIPLADSSVHLVTAFATLHHLYDPLLFFTEAARILHSGGILYTDHDLARPFVKRFGMPLRLWRRLFDHGPEFLRNFPELSREDYELSEYHGENGLEAESWIASLHDLGFTDIEISWHWQGGGGPTRTLELLALREVFERKSWSPFLRICARKV